MAKKSRGHYCKGCGRYRANEKFSGKGHKIHICKDCKKEGRAGVEEEQFSQVKQRHNPYRKPLKIKLIMKNDTEEYIIFQYMGKRYAVIVGNYFQIPVIFRYETDRDIPFFIADGLMKDFEEVWEVITLKYDYKIDQGNYLDYRFMDEYDEIEWNELVVDSEYLELVEKFRAFIMGVTPKLESIHTSY